MILLQILEKNTSNYDLLDFCILKNHPDLYDKTTKKYVRKVKLETPD